MDHQGSVTAAPRLEAIDAIPVADAARRASFLARCTGLIERFADLAKHLRTYADELGIPPADLRVALTSRVTPDGVTLLVTVRAPEPVRRAPVRGADVARHLAALYDADTLAAQTRAERRVAIARAIDAAREEKEEAIRTRR